MQKHRSFKPEFKARVILQLLSGEKSAAQICREHRLSDQLLANWKKQFLENADSIFDQVRDGSFEQERIAELERMVGRLTMELEAAKKASLLLTPRSQRNGRRSTNWPCNTRSVCSVIYSGRPGAAITTSRWKPMKTGFVRRSKRSPLSFQPMVPGGSAPNSDEIRIGWWSIANASSG